jgi:hypothetical protein
MLATAAAYHQRRLSHLRMLAYAAPRRSRFVESFSRGERGRPPGQSA